MADLRHLLIYIPGIGGSVLRDLSRPTDDQLVWQGGFGPILSLLSDPEQLAIDRELEPVGLLDDFSINLWFKTIDVKGYSEARARLGGLFPRAAIDWPTTSTGGEGRILNLDAQIVGFPYDFRHSVEHASERLAAEIAERVDRLGDGTRVWLLAHSMGGLVARHWVAHHDTERRCDAVYTFGTPHGGAPKALDVLANGLYWKHQLLQRKAASKVIQAWPGLHDLVGIEQRVIDASGDGSPLRAGHEIDKYAQILRRSADMHHDIETWWSDHQEAPGPTLKFWSGLGHETPSAVEWNGRQLKQVAGPLQRDGVTEDLGDSTVPFWASVPHELAGTAAENRMRPAGQRHGQLSCPTNLKDEMLSLTTGRIPPTRGDRDDPVLGLALPEVVGPGASLEGRLLIERFADAPDQVTVRAAVTDADGNTSPLDVDVFDDGSFKADLAAGAAEPGEFHGYIRLDATVDVPKVGRLTAGDMVAVLP